VPQLGWVRKSLLHASKLLIILSTSRSLVNITCASLKKHSKPT
jgi:hypothetical protein